MNSQIFQTIQKIYGFSFFMFDCFYLQSTVFVHFMLFCDQQFSFFVFSVTRKENVLGAKELMRQIIHKLWLKRHHFWHRYKAQNVFFSILFFYIHSTIYSNPVKRNRFKDIIFLNSSEFQIPIFLCNFVLKQQNIHHQYLDYRCSTFHFINLHHS